ncbi:MAG: MmgE/PrpD family protein [Melioribacteraceae bacterium]|nr:MmgE/PrpD family protein [Melioribacteraceae bacterium]MCF8265885.1 MmgE/PrpD family protein [Melioribacteraceae bacterium]MCF8413434.1 MmgE/PrpD family protein [Melioribacteraceae bacterium]MCF8432668.1 MmgE/PrpD family protein [Melioribacteraceae bacterium]
MEQTISRIIANYAIQLNYEDLPERVINQAKKFLYDSIGCAYGAIKTKDVNIIRQIYQEMGGTKQATLIGSGEKIPAVNATLVNSLAIRALDFNDIYWKEDPSHPSDLIPAALSVAELRGKSMKDVITAIVLGYEFEQRMCEFAVPGVRERKWHHATLTQFVSPIVAGKILDLNADQMVNAIGISGSHNHTIGCPTAGKLTMMKNTVDPMAVQSGVFAALMAEKGFTGTEAIFEGKEGLMDVYKPDWDYNKLVGDLGIAFKIMECSMKAFPTEALTHTHISAVLKVMINNNLTYDQIEKITITTIARACDILFDPHKYRPESRETADHSLPYCIAAAVVDKKITTETFSDEKLKDPRIWEVIDKIEGEASEEFEKMFPAKQPSRAKVETKSGEFFEEYLEYPKGHPMEPMTMTDLENKFNSLSSPYFSPERLIELKEIIFSCEKYSASDFMDKLVIN